MKKLIKKLLILFKIHQYDDYGVRVTKHDDIRENIHMFHTPWLFRAVMKYIYFNFKYPDKNIIFTHYRYEKEKK